MYWGEFYFCDQRWGCSSKDRKTWKTKRKLKISENPKLNDDNHAHKDDNDDDDDDDDDDHDDGDDDDDDDDGDDDDEGQPINCLSEHIGFLHSFLCRNKNNQVCSSDQSIS